jgi:hypothetical protein
MEQARPATTRPVSNRSKAFRNLHTAGPDEPVVVLSDQTK